MSATAGPSAAPTAPGLDGAAGGLRLVVRLEAGRYALPLEAVADVAECSALRAVPGAPACVRGLAERHGRVVTVLDLATLVGECPAEAPLCLVRLARPLEHLALAVPAAPRHVTLVAGAPGTDETAAVLLDLDRLLARAEAGLRGSPRGR